MASIAVAAITGLSMSSSTDAFGAEMMSRCRVEAS
jgi:hypothetical protein